MVKKCPILTLCSVLFSALSVVISFRNHLNFSDTTIQFIRHRSHSCVKNLDAALAVKGRMVYRDTWVRSMQKSAMLLYVHSVNLQTQIRYVWALFQIKTNSGNILTGLILIDTNAIYAKNATKRNKIKLIQHRLIQFKYRISQMISLQTYKILRLSIVLRKNLSLKNTW